MSNVIQMKVKPKFTRADLHLLEEMSRLSQGMAELVDEIFRVGSITNEQRRVFDLTIEFVTVDHYGQSFLRKILN